jgi:hypothetical protein
VRSIVIDGEAVVCGKDGKSDFDQLHSGAHDAAGTGRECNSSTMRGWRSAQLKPRRV